MSAIINRACLERIETGHHQCLLCGDDNPWSLKLRFSTGGNGIVSARFVAHDMLQGYQGMVHGGVVAALLDAAMTNCLFQCGVKAVTGDLHIRYLRPVPCQQTLDIHASVEKATPKLYRMKSEIRDRDHLLARADAVFIPWKKHTT